VKDAIERNFGMLDAQAPEVYSAVAHERGRIRATGTLYSLHWVHIVTFRDGKVVRLRENVDGYAIEGPVDV
jgi:ketosteroid isomerase-like protein